MEDPSDRSVRDSLRDQLLAGFIARMAGGDESALGQLYDATLGKVYGLALRITSRHDLAEDVAAEVYLQAWRQAQRYDLERGRPLAWLLTMARTRALDTLRKRDEAESHPEPEVLGEPLLDTEANPLNLLLSLERDSVLHAALRELSAVQRQLLSLAFYRDLSHQEIADHLGMPLGTVKTHIRKGLSAMQAVLLHGKEAS